MFKASFASMSRGEKVIGLATDKESVPQRPEALPQNYDPNEARAVTQNDKAKNLAASDKMRGFFASLRMTSVLGGSK